MMIRQSLNNITKSKDESFVAKNSLKNNKNKVTPAPTDPSNPNLTRNLTKISKKPGNESDAEGTERSDNIILDRSALMDHMLFPENGPTLIIVPSNKQGTGFLNHCYDESYLGEHITE